jgi:uncharacterized repeat protein (TIGR03803 family)
MNIAKANKFTCPGAASRAAWVLPALAAGFGLILAGQASAQTFTNLHSFTGRDDGDAGNPQGGVILSGNTLFGTTEGGTGVRGGLGYGTIFAENTDGTDYRILYSFTGGSDESEPLAALILSGNTLYGTVWGYDSSGEGTVFSLNTDGTGFTTLYSFTGGSDGARPRCTLVLSGDTLYGTASEGGSSSNGTVFAVNTDGTDFTVLHTFTATSGLASLSSGPTNSDGALPYAGLFLSGNTLYGTAVSGGSAGHGTVFALNTDGTGFTVLHSFAASPTNSAGLRTNSDGILPWAGVILSGNTLYGTATTGGPSGHGTVFAVNTDGTGFTVLHSFTDTNSDGAQPEGGLLLSGNTLYGTAEGGGSAANGVVFALNTDGTGFTILGSLVNSKDGEAPDGELALSGNTLYGATPVGGPGQYGTLFSLSLPPVTGPQFSVAVTPSSVTVDPGGDATYNLTIDSLGGFSGEVALSASGLPTGATVSFSAASVTAPGTASLTITTAATIAAGSYTLTITGTSGSLVEQATATLVVAAPNFSLSASPAIQSVKAGSSTTYEATVTSSGGFDGAVSFSASGLPSGATASFSPASVSGSGSSTMTVATKSTIRTGSTSFTIRGTGLNGSPVHSTTATLTITK